MARNRTWYRTAVCAAGLVLLSGRFARPAPPGDALAAADGPRPAFTSDAERSRAVELSKQVTIHRDAYGVPHIDAKSEGAAIFGLAYAQAEDFFWQIEDNYILSLGRYAEVHGTRGLNSDLLNRAFEIVPHARASFELLSPEIRDLCGAFVSGLNWYLASHPDVHPRLIAHFEPWQLLAYGRHMMLELCFRRTGLSKTYMPRAHDRIWTMAGSNGWALAPAKTASGHAMLLANPHLPWFGYGQLYEVHLRSDRWNMTGALPFGSPMPSLGHNEHLGWTLTTNEPDIADVWRVTFDDPEHPLNYRYGDGYRTAQTWQETIRVRTSSGLADRVRSFRKTHYGPIVSQEGSREFLAARIAGLSESAMLRQLLGMARARNLGEFREALALQQFPLMNVVYADRQGNIFYLYNGLIPRRDPQFDWSKPVDGADPRTEWQAIHTIDELPQVLNPSVGYVQNCNSSPFTTCGLDSPRRADFPSYLAEDADDDKRRAKRSRQILESFESATFGDLKVAAFDTTVYWAQQELPEYGRRFDELKLRDAKLAAEVEDFLSHLLAWDCQVTLDSTAATLCEAWYTEMFGLGYPAETMKPMYQKSPDRQFRALIRAAAVLKSMHGSWQVPWGELFRIQRHASVADFIEVPFSDRDRSLPCPAAPGPMGVIFTQYYSPSLRIPFLRTLKKRYGLIGASYLAVYEFGDKVESASVVNFGTSGDPKSPHFFDQAQLLSQCTLKKDLFEWDEVVAAAVETYHPGERNPTKPQEPAAP